jgi:hypothetical protein
VGGTSAGPPQWAAIIAVSDQLRAAADQGQLTGANFQTNTTLYGLLGTSAISDITSGSNGSCGSICTAGPGYDFVAGLGSPRTDIDTMLAGTTPTATPTPPPVGGIAELPVLARASADEAGTSTDDPGWSPGNYAALAGRLAVAVAALATGAWYARRRWLR